MNYYLDNNNVCTHPVALLPYKDYKRLEDNIIVLDKPNIVNENSLSRKIYYDIQSIGKNLVFETRNGISKIKLKETKRNFFMMVLHKQNVESIKKVAPFCHYSRPQKKTNGKNNGRKFLILMQCGVFLEQKEDEISRISESDMRNYTSVIPNQITTKEKHFNSLGEVYSIGYSAKYKIQNGLSFEHFVTSKWKKLVALTFCQKFFL